MDEPTGQPPQPTTSLDQFEILIGEWTMLGTHPGLPSPIHGRLSFLWLQPGLLLIWHFDWDETSPPNATSVIGHDDADSSDTCTMLYADERGVARIYQMSLANGVRKVWRDSSGFAQRTTGTFSEDRNTITVHGELSRDNTTWQQDLNVTYTRIISK
jgi:hypothetical protein